MSPQTIPEDSELDTHQRTPSRTRPRLPSLSTTHLRRRDPLPFGGSHRSPRLPLGHAHTGDELFEHTHEDMHRTHLISAAEFRHMQQEAQSHPPLLQRLLTNQYSVTNPVSNHHPLYDVLQGNASVLLFGMENITQLADAQDPLPDGERQRRLLFLNALRPQRLIGDFKYLANWTESFRAESDIRRLRLRELQQYYRDQNYLIQRFHEIDKFLDCSKIHINMLSTYGKLPEPEGYGAIEHAPTFRSFCFYLGLQGPAAKSKFKRSSDVPGNIHEGAQLFGGESSEDVMFAIIVNFVINFVLLVGKIVVSVLSNSISVVASLIDSVLDFLSTFIVYIANKLSTTKNWRTHYAYPVGRLRLEPLGVLIFSVIIIISFFQVGEELFKRLFLLLVERHVPATIGKSAIVIMAATIFAKIGCWLWCASSKSLLVQALAQDAMTDIVFNFFSLLMPTLGYYLNVWWLDPAGALFLLVYIVVSWGRTAFEHIDNLTGAVAHQLEYKVVLYLAYRFAELIKQITALKVYHVGDKLNVEIDVVFENDLSFRDCHDIAEALQYSLEALPMVERAYVHIDYMEGNFKGHLE